MKIRMNKGKSSSLNVQIIIIIGTFSCLMVIFLLLFQIVLLDDFYRDVKTSALKKTAQEISRTVSLIDYSENMDKDTFEEEMQTISIQVDSCGLIRSAKSNVVVKANTKIVNCGVNQLSESDVEFLTEKAIKNNGSYTVYSNSKVFLLDSDNNPNKKQSVLYTKIAYDTNGNLVTIILTTNLKAVDVVADVLSLQIWITGVIFLLGSLIASIFLYRKIAKPIKVINDRAKLLAQGDFEPTFNGSGYLEAEQLSETLNNTALELSKSENYRKEIIANVSHDLRTPLTMIGGYAEVMRDIPDENTPENLQIIIDEASRLTAMVNELLDSSKVMAGQTVFETENMNFTQYLLNVVNRYRKMMEPLGYHIEFEYDQEVMVKFDVTRMNQVVYNLLNNAINYTSEENKLVIVKQTITQDKVRIDVIDDGEGVKEEDLTKIWNRYYQSDKEHKRAEKGTGTGLGLAIVKGVLEAYNSEYGVESQWHHGCDFYFILPIVK